MIKEFREFALRGNVVDMAIGVIIGVAFGKIVSSLVADIIMPPLGLALGNVDFSSLFFQLGGGAPIESLERAKEAGVPTLNYGVFIQSIVDFILVAFVLFLVIRGMNRFKSRGAADLAPATRECPECLSSVPLAARRCASCTSALV